MKIAFDNENNRYKAYGKVDIYVKGQIIETSEQELNDKVPDSFEGDWKDNKAYFKLESGEIVFDESYEPETTTGGN